MKPKSFPKEKVCTHYNYKVTDRYSSFKQDKQRLSGCGWERVIEKRVCKTCGKKHQTTIKKNYLTRQFL